MRCDLGAILEIAEKRGCAIPAFNVYNMETVLGVMNAAKETKSPVIFQIYSRLFDSREARYMAALVREAMDELETPAAVDLFMKGPMEAVKNFAISKIKLLGADA